MKHWSDMGADERTKFLKKHFEKGTNTGVIISKLPQLGVYGATRNAIIGHCTRHMQGELLPPPLRPSTFDKPKPRTLIPNRRILPKKIAPLPKQKVIKAAKYKPIEKTLMELELGDCRRPLWPHNSYPSEENMKFCANPAIEGKSWCEHCAKTYIWQKQSLEEKESA